EDLLRELVPLRRLLRARNELRYPGAIEARHTHGQLGRRNGDATDVADVGVADKQLVVSAAREVREQLPDGGVGLVGDAVQVRRQREGGARRARGGARGV